MEIKQITPEEAKNFLDSGENYIYLDVRSEGEFQQGHPAGAYNLPVKHLNIAVQQLEDNPDFVEVVEANFGKDAKLLLGCGSGPRSNAACEMIAARGYQDLANIDGGFSGARDMYGNITKQGWMQLGYPVEDGSGEDRSYETLKGKTGEDSLTG